MKSDSPHTSPGLLTLVSTPIGNLGDMTVRGIEILKQVDAVLAEDTRHTRKLFTKYSIQNRLVSYHDFNKERVTPGIIKRLKQGENLALVTDAGTPGISDPGFYLVRAAIGEGLKITVAPGANAILPSLILSGFPTDAFIFVGFLPKKAGELRRRIAEIKDESRTTVYFVSPYRLVKVLEMIGDELQGRRIAVIREATKLHEEVRRGTAEELVTHFQVGRVKGEIVIVVEGIRK